MNHNSATTLLAIGTKEDMKKIVEGMNDLSSKELKDVYINLAVLSAELHALRRKKKSSAPIPIGGYGVALE